MIPAQVQNLENNDNLKTTQEQFDTVIVFGEGPVKPVLIPSELTKEQKEKWEQYRKDELRTKEPNFRVIESEKLLLKIETIESNPHISEQEKIQQKEHIRQEWQNNGWLALKRMGRQNALAAGYALYKGITKKVVLSGGKTIPKWAKERISKETLPIFPSEAVLMLDIMRRYYGGLYKEKYGTSIDEAVIIEDAATNTLENFAYTVNKYPDILKEGQRVGFLSAKHHLKRLMVLARLFSIQHNQYCQLPAQELVKKSIDGGHIENQEVDFIADEQNCPDTTEQKSREERWLTALQDPQYLSYWLGYVAEVQHPAVIKKAIDKLQEPEWCIIAREEFKKLGLNVDDYSCEDIALVAKRNPARYQTLVNGLRRFKKPEYRKMPPVIGLA